MHQEGKKAGPQVSELVQHGESELEQQNNRGKWDMGSFKAPLPSTTDKQAALEPAFLTEAFPPDGPRRCTACK